MRKGEIVSKIFGIALVLVLVGTMLGGLPRIGNNVAADEVVIFETGIAVGRHDRRCDLIGIVRKRAVVLVIHDAVLVHV